MVEAAAAAAAAAAVVCGGGGTMGMCGQMLPVLHSHEARTHVPWGKPVRLHHP